MSLIFTSFDLYAVCILIVHMQEQQMTGFWNFPTKCRFIF